MMTSTTCARRHHQHLLSPLASSCVTNERREARLLFPVAHHEPPPVQHPRPRRCAAVHRLLRAHQCRPQLHHHSRSNEGAWPRHRFFPEHACMLSTHAPARHTLTSVSACTAFGRRCSEGTHRQPCRQVRREGRSAPQVRPVPAVVSAQIHPTVSFVPMSIGPSVDPLQVLRLEG